MVEWLGHQFSGTFDDLAAAFGGAYPYILAGFTRAFANIPGCTQRMQRHEIAGAFADSLGSLASALACAFADVTAAAPYIAACASSVGLRGGSGLAGGGLGLRGLRLRSILPAGSKFENHRRR
jgi:hypothetical protein